MKLTISRETLLDQFIHVIGAVEKKHTSKILENVYLQVNENILKLIGTDLEIEMSASINIQADALGQITAPARKLYDICKALPQNCFIVLETDDNQRLHITGLRSHFELATLPAEDFPILDDIPINKEISITESNLKKLLEKVSFSMANQDVRYYLNGLLLEFSNNKILAVSTDGHRLAISEYCTENDDLDNLKIIVPRKGILELSRLLDTTSESIVTLQLSDNHIRIQKEGIRFTSKLIDGKYPDYQAAIPSDSLFSLNLQREEFRDTLARVAILSNEKFRGIRIGLKNGTMTLHSNNPENESADEEIDIEYDGDQFEIGFNVSYLLEAVNHLNSEKITLELSSPDTSALLHELDNNETRYIVMPIRL